MYYTGAINSSIFDSAYKDVIYTREPFNCKKTIDFWKSNYGEIFRTGELADHRSELPAWTNKIKSLFDLSFTECALYRMTPGDIIPYHKDTYKNYIKYYNIDNPIQIWRVVVFLEDWSPGHIFEIEGNPICNYKAGTFVQWNYDAEHMAGNLGFIDRYTMQITGCKR